MKIMEPIDPRENNNFAFTSPRHKISRREVLAGSAAAGAAMLLGNAGRAGAEQNPVTAIDVALEPDATMIQHAKANNARLLKTYPNGFALDATHNPHVTLLQQFVRAADLDKVYAAADKALTGEQYAYDRNAAFGRLDKALDAAASNKWVVVDMKNDWNRVFAFE